MTAPESPTADDPRPPEPRAIEMVQQLMEALYGTQIARPQPPAVVWAELLDRVRDYAAGVRPVNSEPAAFWKAEAQRYQAERDELLDGELERERAAHLATKAALGTVRDELNKHGHGDMHYGNMPRNPKVLAALEVADRALADPEEPHK